MKAHAMAHNNIFKLLMNLSARQEKKEGKWTTKPVKETAEEKMLRELTEKGLIRKFYPNTV